jgi:vancomycin permeability regulator SanA
VFLIIAAISAVLIMAMFVFTRALALYFAGSRLSDVETVSGDRVAIVFGAGLRRDGTPSPILRDRIATAAQLYFAGKVEKLLMSGDNRFEYYNEPGAMQEYAVELGVPREDIVLDYAGRRTYDTCYRAREIFRLKSAILVTQGFHLPRAIYVCNQLGLPAIGVPADQREYRNSSRLYWNLRETVATLVALWEVHVSKPIPVLGNPEPIFPTEAQ